MRRYVYDITPGDESKWIRLRDNGNGITLAVKQITNDSIDGTHEVEVTVSDFTAANELLKLMGFMPKSYQRDQARELHSRRCPARNRYVAPDSSVSGDRSSDDGGRDPGRRTARLYGA